MTEEFMPILRDLGNGFSDYIITPAEMQQIYDQIKSRLISEANMSPQEYEEWCQRMVKPLDCQGTTDGKGKVG